MRALLTGQLVGAVLLAIASPVIAQSISRSSLSQRSSGSGSGNWTLSENGYLGTYISLASPGSVTLTVNASGSTNDAVLAHMNVVIADSKASFDVAAGFNNYQHTFDLPAGTYFVRTEFNNDAPTANRQLTVGSLTVSGATVSNTNSTTTNDASALAAADTYIAHFRQGPAHVALVGAAPGASVEVRMVKNAFNVGTMVEGFDANTFLAPIAPGDTTSTAARYQNFVNTHFNSLVPSNVGKWQPTENIQNVPTMGNVDTILDYAQSHDMNVRMHNLIWGAQQPTWVNTLITNAQSSNPATAAQAKSDLMTAIANRIKYYVGDGPGGFTDEATRYSELDVLNEALRNQAYYQIFGYNGIAQIYKMAQDAVSAAGAQTRLYTNEYNVLQYSNDPFNTAVQDPYANWYRREVESLNNAGSGDVVTGIGVQYAVDARTSNAQVHSPARIAEVMNNLSVTGLPITLTEFSVQPSLGGVTISQARSAQIYNETLRLLFGTPQATSFLIWEAWPPATTDNTTIVDSAWNLTPSGQALVNLLNSWTTPTQNLLVGPDGTIDFSGFYGDYEVTVGGKKFDLNLAKGTSDYSLLVALPGDFNGDGNVDSADLAVWQAGFGTSAAGDADGDGDTDGQDFILWQRYLGQTSAAAATAVVPEPGATPLCLIAYLFIRRRRS